MWTDVGLAWELVEQPQSKKQNNCTTYRIKMDQSKKLPLKKLAKPLKKLPLKKLPSKKLPLKKLKKPSKKTIALLQLTSTSITRKEIAIA